MGDLSKYFSRNEFACKDGCKKDDIDFAVVYDLTDIREAFGRPIKVTSGCRCEKHNAIEGGKPDSSHLTGKAVDIECLTGVDRYLLLLLALNRFHRIGIGKTFIHLDHDLTKPEDVCWLY